MESENLNRLTLLGHAGRMSVFRLLMRRYPDALAAGEIAVILGTKPSTLSVYLSALTQGDLISQTREGTSLRYRIRMETARALVDFLFLDCCRGRPDLCPPSLSLPSDGAVPMDHRKFNVLFICSGNSARSIFAEAILSDVAGDRFDAYSAGTRPNSELNPFAVEMLKAKGHDITQLRSKHISEFQDDAAPRLDFVFTVCDRSANEECPPWAGQPMTAHWGMPDPVKAEGTDAQKRLAFQQAYGMMRNRIIGFSALPIATLDRTSLQAAIDTIADAGAGADA
ncbi:MAG: ArsR family transcriptional regulator [Pseudomonadota bacterium]